MKQYRENAEKRLTNKVHPDRAAQLALSNAKFSQQHREEFFTDAYGEILVDLFLQWLSTEPHENKSRDHLYHCAMALGSVKEKMIQFETYGKNIQNLQETKGSSNGKDN